MNFFISFYSNFLKKKRLELECGLRFLVAAFYIYVLTVLFFSFFLSPSVSYGKYKPLKAPAKCSRCREKRVKSAYHTLCDVCVGELSACAKCGRREAEVVNQPAPTRTEEARVEAELQKLLKLLPERRRRTVVRKLQEEEKGR